MRVLQVHNRYRQRGGEDTVADAEAVTLEDAGHEVHRLITANPSNVRAIGSLARATWNSATYREVVDHVEHTRPDVAHVHNTWFRLSPSVLGALRDCGVPTVWTAHNYRFACANGLLLRGGAPCTLCVGNSPWRAIGYSCYRDPLSSAVAAATIARAAREGAFTNKPTLIIALTEFAKGLMVEGGFDPERVIVKSNFTDDPGKRTVSAGSSDYVLFVGRLSEEKGVHVVVEAWKRRRPDLRLVVVGDGNYDTSATVSGVEFLGARPREQVLALMLGARALIFPSLWFEGQPMVLLEALGAGLPILGSHIGALPELVRSPVFEGLFPPGDSDAMFELVLSLDDRTADEASAAARTRWEAEFSPHVGRARLERVYRRARREASRAGR